ncbi:mannosyl-oligosaccharide 1,2-alpha-mannosidase MNS1-like [Iris pallida]|uniref:Mannosyl-oligosaccharide 1,2-alpha-mannosidase MNS1-like n=1 Tax=Iris pallida TaxID=29817 RepID=A0AAX6DKN1_IRIPA|nr:mannosyl-oligosaccharide 1,2-alpha-mannosidase MNS1-like [Iris pallida]
MAKKRKPTLINIWFSHLFPSNVFSYLFISPQTPHKLSQTQKNSPSLFDLVSIALNLS